MVVTVVRHLVEKEVHCLSLLSLSILYLAATQFAKTAISGFGASFGVSNSERNGDDNRQSSNMQTNGKLKLFELRLCLFIGNHQQQNISFSNSMQSMNDGGGRLVGSFGRSGSRVMRGGDCVSNVF